MSTNVERKLYGWVKKQCFLTRKQGKCARLVLHHVGTNGKLGPEIVTINVGEHKEADQPINDEDCHEYTSELYGEATNYAEGIGATQSYAIAAYFDDEPDRALARYALKINVEGVDEEGDVSSEPATMEGMTKQLMRHLEAKERIMVGSFGTIMNALQTQNRQLTEMVSKMFEERSEQLDAIETLMSAKHERDMEIADKEVSAKFKGQMIEGVSALLPAVANRILGKKILPETTDITLMQVVKLAQALGPGDLERILGAIDDPAKKIAFIELIQSVQERTSTADDTPINGMAGTSMIKAPS